MICPICGEEMKQGVMELSVRDLPAIWYPSDVNKEKGFFKSLVSRLKCDDAKLCMPDEVYDPTAWYCPSCKKIWMSFDEITDK